MNLHILNLTKFEHSLLAEMIQFTKEDTKGKVSDFTAILFQLNYKIIESIQNIYEASWKHNI